MKENIRIAGGQGFWGDLPDAPVRQVEDGPIDYLMLDYLAEVTMSSCEAAPLEIRPPATQTSSRNAADSARLRRQKH